MAIFARIEKMAEDEREVRYSYNNGKGETLVAILDKDAETIRSESGECDILYDAVARKIAVSWDPDSEAPAVLMVQS